MLGPNLDEGPRTLLHELGRSLREADGRGQLVDEQRRDARRGLEPRGDGRHERGHRLAEADLVDRGSQPLCCAGDERRMERAGDAKLDRPARAFFLGSRTALVHRLALTGDDELARAVVVRRPHAADPAAQALHDVVVEPQDRRHRARVLARRLGHREAPLANERDRLGDADRRGRRQSGELADRVADHIVGLDASRLQRGEHGEAGGDERGLLDVRLDELVELGVEAESAQVEPRRLAAQVEDAHRLGHRLRDVTSHPLLQRPLPGEAERDLSSCHAAISFVHSITPEPQVRPAPIPVIRTIVPSPIMPAAAASASASGIDPDDVLP